MPEAHPVGTSVCAACHQAQWRAWQGSHHQLAMQPASDGSVLAPFRGERFSADGVTSSFTRHDGKFFVRTDGPHGRLHDYEITHTLGVTPLQQYLIPMADGGMQALGIAWDTRPSSQGGQRWFHLQGKHPPKAGDELHWTGRQQNWNFMCADCHVTQFKKNFDANTRRYASTWSETAVTCEACHGPGSNHVAWAQTSSPGQRTSDPAHGLVTVLDERKEVRWAIAASTGNAVRSQAPTGQDNKELKVCARCHSHRSQISDDSVHGKPLLDTHIPSLLQPGLYWNDGQMRAEVYNQGSFLQSKMHGKGVTCSDCHEPHSQKLRAPGNRVCFQCHAPARYDAQAHHFHFAGSAGAQCAACHMPNATYMSVDVRHDHFIRVPRPDVSQRLGTPNACNQCHADKTPQWAAQWAMRWYPHLPQRPLPLAEALHAVERGEPSAQLLLMAVMSDPQQPAIARATAASRLPVHMSRAGQQQVIAMLADTDPLVRLAAVEALRGVDAALRTRVLAPALADPVKAVRIAAARWLAAVPAQALDASVRGPLDRALAEYVAVQQFNADRPESYNNLGTLYADQGDMPRAEAALKKAIEIEPRLAESSLNLADIYRALGREAEAQALILSVIQREPALASAHHALGLSLLRQHRITDALRALQQASKLAPDDARYAYVYAVALDASGSTRQAIAVLEAARVHQPQDRDLLRALVSSCKHLPDLACARRYAAQLAPLEGLR